MESDELGLILAGSGVGSKWGVCEARIGLVLSFLGRGEPVYEIYFLNREPALKRLSHVGQ
jgi:hypothetical protein